MPGSVVQDQWDAYCFCDPFDCGEFEAKILNCLGKSTRQCVRSNRYWPWLIREIYTPRLQQHQSDWKNRRQLKKNRG
jgi:hypothetical protein